jgi:hypothetical protein
MFKNFVVTLYLVPFPYKAQKHTSFTSEASTCSYSFQGQKKRILDLPSPYFPPLLYDQLCFYGEGFIEPPMGHERMGIGKEPCGLNIMPFFGYTLKRGHKLCVHRKDLSTSKLMKSLIQKRFDELTKCLLTKHI